MPSELPIACSLTADELPTRLATIADLGREALLDVQLTGAHARLRFAARPGVRDRLDGIVAAESQCCAFLTMRIDADATELSLTIDAPDGAELVLAELVEAFRAERPAA
jgi:hypothetical protein